MFHTSLQGEKKKDFSKKKLFRSPFSGTKSFFRKTVAAVQLVMGGGGGGGTNCHFFFLSLLGPFGGGEDEECNPVCLTLVLCFGLLEFEVK